MAGPELTPDLLAQLEEDAAWWAPDPPYRLTVEGGKTIDGDYEDFNEMTIYGILDDGSSHEVATFHVDNMAPRAVRLFAAVPALVAAARHRDQLLGDNMALVSEGERVRAAQHDEIAQLRAEVEQIAGTSLGAMRRETAQLRDMLADRKEEIEQLSELLGQSQWDRINLAEQVDQLRAEVERLRGLGHDACNVLESTSDKMFRRDAATNIRALVVQSPVRDFDPLGPADQLPADVLADVETERGMRQIERKP